MSGVKICVVTGSRAEFGQLLPLLLKLQEDSFFDLRLIVTGSHLSVSSGYTVDEITEAGFSIEKKILIDVEIDNSRMGISKQIGDAIAKFAEYFNKYRPDMLIAIGDRYEMFAAGVAAWNMLIPICHICGGSTTCGAMDELYRHSLTKMSILHFTTCDEYRKRVIQLGEPPSTVFNVGSLAIENCLNVALLSKNELLTQLGLNLDVPYCVVTFHPVTLEKDTQDIELTELIKAFDMNPQFQYLITLSNTDSGGERINKRWRQEELKHPNYVVVSSLGMKRYLTALKYAEMMIGNSSSGTTEGPAMRIPVIDIGDRQKGRVFCESLIHCNPIAEEINKAIKRAESKEFKEIAQNVVNPFGDGTTSGQMIDILKTTLAKPINNKKEFFNIDFEV